LWPTACNLPRHSFSLRVSSTWKSRDELKYNLHLVQFKGLKVTIVPINDSMTWLISVNAAVWIGLYRKSWEWVDGSTSSFRYWKSGEPNNVKVKENCVAANFGASGIWEDDNCDVEKPFICNQGKCKEMFNIAHIFNLRK
uniref:C-type lectin domain-containing protein n=1 Tax=Fundulus heteroclitus TaxID=8078 RepID=A0A3Q2Q6R4_FUNHE